MYDKKKEWVKNKLESGLSRIFPRPIVNIVDCPSCQVEIQISFWDPSSAELEHEIEGLFTTLRYKKLSGFCYKFKRSFLCENEEYLFQKLMDAMVKEMFKWFLSNPRV